MPSLASGYLYVAVTVVWAGQRRLCCAALGSAGLCWAGLGRVRPGWAGLGRAEFGARLMGGSVRTSTKRVFVAAGCKQLGIETIPVRRRWFRIINSGAWCRQRPQERLIFFALPKDLAPVWANRGGERAHPGRSGELQLKAFSGNSSAVGPWRPVASKLLFLY